MPPVGTSWLPQAAGRQLLPLPKAARPAAARRLTYRRLTAPTDCAPRQSQIDTQYFWAGAPWDMVARKYVADTLNAAALSGVTATQNNVIAASAMEATGLARERALLVCVCINRDGHTACSALGPRCLLSASCHQLPLPRPLGCGEAMGPRPAAAALRVLRHLLCAAIVSLLATPSCRGLTDPGPAVCLPAACGSGGRCRHPLHTSRRATCDQTPSPSATLHSPQLHSSGTPPSAAPWPSHTPWCAA